MSKSISWRKIGGGSFRMANGRIIKSNQVFQATPDEIPEAFRDVVVPYGEVSPDPEEEAIGDTKTNYIVRPRVNKDGSISKVWYDVVNSETGKAMNEKALRKKSADEKLRELS